MLLNLFTLYFKKVQKCFIDYFHQVCFTAVKYSTRIKVSVLFLLIRNLCEELLRHLILTQLVIHSDHQPLGLGIHVTDLYPSLVMEEHMVALSCSINTHVKLLLLDGTAQGKYKDTQNINSGRLQTANCTVWLADLLNTLQYFNLSQNWRHSENNHKLSATFFLMWTDIIIHYLCVWNKGLNEEVLQHTLCLSHLQNDKPQEY